MENKFKVWAFCFTSNTKEKDIKIVVKLGFSSWRFSHSFQNFGVCHYEFASLSLPCHVNYCLMVYRAISIIEVVASKPQAYVMRPKGSVGNCKFVLVRKELLISYPLVIHSV